MTDRKTPERDFTDERVMAFWECVYPGFTEDVRKRAEEIKAEIGRELGPAPVFR